MATLTGCLDRGSGGTGQNPDSGTRVGGLGDPETFDIPDPAGDFPTGDVALQWTESSQFSAAVLPTFWEAYGEKHGNVTVNYDNLPDVELARVLQLAFQSGDIPDVFRLLPEIIPGAVAVSQGLVEPIDEIIPNFDEWQQTFPESSFLEGINVFDGKAYTFPMLGLFSQVLQYNREYLSQADLDPAAEPFSFETFRAAAKKLTDQGEGQYYGLVIGGSDIARWSSAVTILGNLAGAVGSDFDYRRGEFNYTTDAYAEVVELLLAMKSDGSIDPAAVSINSDQARGKLPSGQGAMILNETGVIPFWMEDSPEFDFGVAPAPSQSADTMIGSSPTGRTFYWVGSGSEQTEVIGDIFSYLGSDAGMAAWQTVGGGAIPVIKPDANANADVDERLRAAYEYFDDRIRVIPAPEARKPGASLVAQKRKPVNPDFGTVIQGIFTGQLDDPQAALKDLQDRSDRALDEAIDAANAEGAEMSRDDWVFGNWDPTRHYAQADYDAL